MLESRENYLEAILMLKQELGQVRSIDIARKLNYSKPSVSRAVGILKKGGYILVDAKGYISLTSEGLKKAESIYERHRTLTSLFVQIAGVPMNFCRLRPSRSQTAGTRESRAVMPGMSPRQKR